MTREEAIARIKDHKAVHKMNEPKAIYISEALDIAIEALEQQPCDDWYDVPSDEMTLEQARQAVKNLRKKLIEHLEKNPCEDAVSRQAVLDQAVDYGSNTYLIPVNSVKTLPSVTPKEKTGRWIMPQQDDGMSEPIYYQVRCSKCNFDLDPQTWHQELHRYNADKYCPNCGARMVSE